MENSRGPLCSSIISLERYKDPLCLFNPSSMGTFELITSLAPRLQAEVDALTPNMPCLHSQPPPPPSPPRPKQVWIDRGHVKYMQVCVGARGTAPMSTGHGKTLMSLQLLDKLAPFADHLSFCRITYRPLPSQPANILSCFPQLFPTLISWISTHFFLTAVLVM